MFEHGISFILKRAINDFTDDGENIQDKIQIGVWSGLIQLEHLGLKPSILSLVNSSVALKYGYIGKLEIRIPWSSLGSEPVTVLVDKVYMLIEPKCEWNPQAQERREQVIKQAKLAAAEIFANFELNKTKEGTSMRLKYTDVMKNYFFNAFMGRIIDNIQITVHGVHIRYEDKLSCSTNFCNGIACKSLQLSDPHQPLIQLASSGISLSTTNIFNSPKRQEMKVDNSSNIRFSSSFTRTSSLNHALRNNHNQELKDISLPSNPTPSFLPPTASIIITAVSYAELLAIMLLKLLSMLINPLIRVVFFVTLFDATGTVTAFRVFGIPAGFDFSRSAGAKFIPPLMPATVSSFQHIRENKKFFVDNSRFIPELIEHPRALFCRPQRFGKSLFVQMLRTFYDRKLSNKEFNGFFKDLEVVSKLQYTEGSRSYFVLNLEMDFDMGPDFKHFNTYFNDHMNGQIEHFFQYYGLNNGQIDKLINRISAAESLNSVSKFISNQRKGDRKLFILLDEYDRTLNRFIARDYNGLDEYIKLSKEYEGMKAFFSHFKTMALTSGSPLEDFRLYITGISPMFLRDVSALNDIEDISNTEQYADMVGFKKNDILNALNVLETTKSLAENQKDEIMEMFQVNCNGYYFFHCKESLYNPFLCTHLLKKIGNPKSNFLRSVLRNETIDKDFRTSSQISDAVITLVANSTNGGLIALQLQQPNCRFAATQLNDQITLQKLLKEDEVDKQTNLENYLSFLIFHGILTYDGYHSRQNYFNNNITLKIPNKIIEREVSVFQKQLNNYSFKIAEFINNTTDTSHLKEIFDKIFINTETFLNYNMGESSISLALEIVFNTAISAYCRREKVKVAFNENEKSDNGYFGIVIETDEKVIIIELKRIRKNAFKIPNTIFSQERNGKWSLVDKKHFKSLITSYSEPEMKSFRLFPSFKSMYKGHDGKIPDTIKNVVEGAIGQVQKYSSSKEIDNIRKGKEFHQFVAVQVGYPFIVEEVKERSN